MIFSCSRLTFVCELNYFGIRKRLEARYVKNALRPSAVPFTATHNRHKFCDSHHLNGGAKGCISNVQAGVMRDMKSFAGKQLDTLPMNIGGLTAQGSNTPK